MVNVSKTSEANVPCPRPMWDADDAFYVVIRPGGGDVMAKGGHVMAY